MKNHFRKVFFFRNIFRISKKVFGIISISRSPNVGIMKYYPTKKYIWNGKLLKFDHSTKEKSVNLKPTTIYQFPYFGGFEFLLASQKNEFCENCAILSDNQFGFRRQLSCQIALNTKVYDWKLALHTRKVEVAFFIDL